MAVIAASGAPPSGTTQWLSGSAQEGPWSPIVGAQHSHYSPVPNDLGRWLACRVKRGTQKAMVVASAPAQALPGWPPYVASCPTAHEVQDPGFAEQCCGIVLRRA